MKWKTVPINHNLYMHTVGERCKKRQSESVWERKWANNNNSNNIHICPYILGKSLHCKHILFVIVACEYFVSILFVHRWHVLIACTQIDSLDAAFAFDSFFFSLSLFFLSKEKTTTSTNSRASRIENTAE